VREYLARRQGQGQKGVDGLYQLADKKEGQPAWLQGLAGRPVALLCTNLAWDSASLDRGVAFPTMMAWLQETVEVFRRQPDWQLVVRVHPAEGLFGSGEPVVREITRRVGALPPNIRLVGPEEAVNTYAIAERAKAVLVWSSSLGMEMAAMGLPVVVCARQHYRGAGFTWDAQSPEQYANLVAAIMTGRLGAPAGARELAETYAYMWYFEYQHELPFRTFDRYDVAQVSLEALHPKLCSPGCEETFNTLRGLRRRAPTPIAR
jgi:hypothetical protein